MEDKVAAAKAKKVEEIDVEAALEEVAKINQGKLNNNGSVGGHKVLEEIIDDVAKLNDEKEETDEESDDEFTGQSCLLVTWKTNPEVERLKVYHHQYLTVLKFWSKDLYMEDNVKTHKRKSKNLVDPGDLVSEKSLQRSYKILGKVIGSN